MDEEERGRLFVPYASKKPGGTGVGMLTVKKIIEEVHRGDLEVTSVKNEGTRVVLRLPGKQVPA
jgi:two-component system nitrogen regulation sensor histidine kinase NtrY